MNILWHMPVLRRDTCGLSIRAVRLAEQLVAAGHRVRFAVDETKTDVEVTHIHGLPLTRLPRASASAPHWSLQARARRHAARMSADRLLAGPDRLEHDLMISCQPELIAAYARLSTRHPIVYVCGGTTLLHDRAEKARQRDLPLHSRLAYTLDRRLKHASERQAFLTADAVVFDSHSTRSRVLKGYRADASRCHVVHGGVDADVFRPPAPRQRADARRRLDIAANATVAAWTGRLSPEKNLELLLHAIPRCVRPPDRVLIVGDGPCEPRLRSLASELRLGDRVVFTGRQPDVRPFLDASDVFAFPSRGESFGGAIVEAMACGLAPIALRPDADVLTATNEIIEDGVSGRLVAPPTPDALAAALDSLLVDAELRTRLGANARARAASQFTWRAAGRRLNDLIDAVARGRSSCRGIECSSVGVAAPVQHRVAKVAAGAPRLP